MQRWQILQRFINKINAQSYLEIGLGTGEVFKRVKCENKTGVDPCFGKAYDYLQGARCEFKPTHDMTSDDFFDQNTSCFDVIFIDGLHTAEQVERDINNSLKFLREGGYIVCHDMKPFSYNAQVTPRRRGQRIWNGDCWKAWVKIRASNPNLDMFVVDTDHGCGIIQKGSQELLQLNGLELTYENLQNNRTEWLNLISVEEFQSNCL